MFVCPAGATAILKSLYVQLQSPTEQDISVTWQRLSPGVTVNIMSGHVLAWGALSWAGWVVLEDLDQLVLSYTAGPVMSAGFGALLQP